MCALPAADANRNCQPLLSAQEFKATFNDSSRNVAGLTAPVDVEKVKKILASTHTNTFLWSVCDCDPDWHVARAYLQHLNLLYLRLHTHNLHACTSAAGMLLSTYLPCPAPH
jgi:hypothetical protein